MSSNDTSLDFHNAFDKNLRKRLLCKIKNHGTGTEIRSWTEWENIWINESN